MFKLEHHFKDFDRFFIGYDKIAGKLVDVTEQSIKLVNKYPPFNIKRVDENRYAIEMAVAGFGKQDLEVEILKDKLLIKGKLTSSEDMSSYIYKGISSKAFTREFTLADNVEIKSVDLLNGMLKIWLETLTPESPKPTKFEINESTE